MKEGEPAIVPDDPPEERLTSGWRHRFFWILAAVALVALGLRLWVGFVLLHSHPAVATPLASTDMAQYLQYARQILAGEYDYSQGFYYQPFYYATFLPIVLLFSGGAMVGVVVAQALLGALTVGLVGMSAAQLFGKRAGLAAAIFLALSRMHVFYTPFALIEVLKGFLLALMIWLALLAYRRRSVWLWLGVGLVAGFGNATRGNLILLLPLLIILVVVALHAHRRRLVSALALLLVAFYLPQLPYAWMNYRALGRWVGPSSAAGAVLALGNTPEAPPGGREPFMGPGPMEYPESFDEWMRQEKLPGDRAVSVGGNMLRWFRREPLAWLELKGRMMLLFWNQMEVPNNVAIPPREQLSLPLVQGPLLLGFLPIGSLGLAGLLLACIYRRRHWGVLFLAASVLVYSASIVLFYVLARFRLPVVPLICLFAGYGCIFLYDAYRIYKRRGQSRRLLAGMAALVGCVMVVGWGYPFYRTTIERHALALARPSGVQVKLEHGWKIMDHGPLNFGGWQPLPIPREVSLRKSFAVPEGVSPDARATLRLRLLSSGGTLSIRLGEGEWQPYYLDRGLRSIDIDAGPLSQANPAVMQLRPQGIEDLQVLIDRQRDYARTLVNGQSVGGELVIELRLDDTGQ